MRCRKAQQLLSVRLDAQLDDTRAQRLNEHLAGCHRCQRFAADLPLCNQALSAMSVQEPQPAFKARVLARLPDRRATLRDWLESVRPAHVAAAAAGVACGVILAVVMNGTAPPQQPDATKPTASFYRDAFDTLPSNSPAANYRELLQEMEE